MSQDKVTSKKRSDCNYNRRATFSTLVGLLLVVAMSSGHNTNRVTDLEKLPSDAGEQSERLAFRKLMDQKVATDATILGLYELMHKRKGMKSSGLRELYEDRSEGESELRAAKLAVEHVNKRKLTGGYQLELYANDTKCDPGVAVDTFFHAIFSKGTRVPILLGTACSEATASLANIVPYWNIVQISFGATSPVLSDRKEFPLFYRVVASDSSHNAARLDFVRHFEWHTVTVISQNEKEYTLAVNDLVKRLEQDNITCKGTVTFGDDDFQDQLELLKELDTRIIFGSFSKEVAPKIFCKVYDLGMYGSDYVWILQGSPHDANWRWWDNQDQCPQHRLHAAAQGLIFVDSYYDNLELSYSGFTNEQLNKELSKQSRTISRYARESYDAVWAAAIALNKTIAEWKEMKSKVFMEDFDYHRNDIAKEIFRQISLMNFTGVSGPISFQGADRIGTSAFYQLQGDGVPMVALYIPSRRELNFSCDSCRNIFWAGGHVPVSQRYLKTRIETIATEAFIVVACCTFLAVILAIFLLIFNLYFRKLKYIKLSSPKLNNIAVVGCIAVYIGVCLLGLDNATLPEVDYFSVICTAKVYFFAAGFSLAFGSIFAKTYRVHNIFIRSQGGFVKKKFLQDTQLILLVCVLLLIDGLILTLWVVIDPMERKLKNLTKEYSAEDRSVIYQPQVEICSCDHLNSWLSSLYMYKGLQLLMGVYMAWETRHVKVPVLNDSQYIGMSVYTVVMTSCIVVVLANLISERPTVAYVTISTMILSSTTATLCLLFFPKIWVILSKSDNNDPVMQSMGFKLESNTRRFVMDDVKEKLYRMEVQNRVFKREALTLKAEIIRLERQMSQPVSRRNSSTSLPSLTCNVKDDLTVEKSTSESSQKNIDPSPYSEDQKYLSLLSKAPRCSWPSEMHGVLKFSRSLSFHSDLQLKEDMDVCTNILLENESKLNVMDKFRSLLRNKNEQVTNRSEQMLRPTMDDTHNQSQRKFSLSRCLLPKRKVSNKDIVIDVTTASNEDISELSVFKATKTKQDEKRKRVQHQTSHPVLQSRGRIKGSPRFPHRIVPASNILMIGESSVGASKADDSGTSSLALALEKTFNADNTKNIIFHHVEVISPESNSE